MGTLNSSRQLGVSRKGGAACASTLDVGRPHAAANALLLQLHPGGNFVIRGLRRIPTSFCFLSP